MAKVSIDNLLYECKDDKAVFKTKYIRYIYQFKHRVNVLIPYPGGKFKMKKELNEVFKQLSKDKSYTTYIDGFFGMGGSLKSLSESLKTNGVKTVYANDINTCIIKMHSNVRNNRIQMIDYFLEVIRNEIVIPYGKLYIDVEDFLILKEKLIQRFNYLQKKKSFGVETSTLFIMLSSFNYSGMVKIQKGGSIKFDKAIYEFSDIEDFLLKTIKRIDTFSELYNKFDMRFFNEDYFNLYKRFKYLKNTLWNIDTVYVKENYDEYIKEDMEKINNSDIVECKVNYSQNNFNHIGVLESLKDINFIYNNNTHPLMYHYVDKFSLQYKLFDRNENINNEKDKKGKVVQEIILYRNNFPQQSNNYIETNPQKKCS